MTARKQCGTAPGRWHQGQPGGLFLDRPDPDSGRGPISRAAGIPNVSHAGHRPGIPRGKLERKDAAIMKRTGRNPTTPTTLTALTLGAALLSLTVAACGAGSGGSPPPASAHTTAEQAATMHWLSETNQMWTDDDFAALDKVTTAGMRTI